MTHFKFAFPNKKSRNKNIFRALGYCLVNIVCFIAVLFFFAFAEPMGGMTDYEFIFNLCIFIGAPLIGFIVFLIWTLRILRSKKIGILFHETKLEIVRYCPLGFTSKLKITVPFQSIENITVSTVNEEIRKNTQCQIYMPNGSECVVINTVDRFALSFCTENNEKFVAMVKEKIET